MREIIFRAKEKETGVWVEGDLVHDLDCFGENKTCIYQITGKGCWRKYFVNQETVCQYTGIEDKNGRKIFEGDIVSAIYKPKDEDLTTDDFIIKWDKYYCKYVGHYARKENVYNPFLFGSQTSFEVIGNIFDNPELIGEKA